VALLAAALALGIPRAHSQAQATGTVSSPTATPAPIEPRYSISVLTFGPGDAVFERFGHNAIRIRDRFTGADLAYNWGMFSFEEPHFLARFLSGDTRYWVEAFPTQWLVDVYAAQDRETVEQVLRLTPTQAAALAAAVERNAQPEHRYYRYDYFRDNCSTRVRDALDAALGGALARRFAGVTRPWTYRTESIRLAEPDRFAQAGIDLALGPLADVPLTAWQAMFIPMRLRDDLREVRFADGPLVAQERVLYTARRAPEAAVAHGLRLGPMGPLVAIWCLLLVPLGAASRRRTRRPAAVMTALWYGLTGLIGVLLFGMWVGSAHVFWYRNLTLLLASPLALVAAGPAARAVWRGAATPLATRLVVALAAQSLLALLVAPMVAQRLAGPLTLLVAANLALAVVVWRHTRPAPAAA
jgi:hypothetical protein